MIKIDGQVVIGTELDTVSFDSQIAYVENQLEEIEDKLKRADMGFEVGDTQKLEAQYEKLIQKLTKLKKSQEDLNKTDLSNIQKNINNVGDGITKTISKVGKWALAIFAIESAYGAVRNAMSTLSQYDEQLQSNIQYIQYALANSLKPLIESILNLVVKLLQYINYIANAWFGINLFSSAEDYKSMADSAKETAKSAKETKKSLANGIDEITNLDPDSNNNKDDAGIKMPSFDLSSLDGEIPAWLKWIADNKDIILSVMAGVAAGLLAWKLGLSGLQSLGIGLAVAGIVYAIQSILEYLKDPSFENFGKIITGVGIAIAGIAIAFGAWPVAVAGAIVAVVGIIVSYWEQIKSFLQSGIDWLAGKSDWVHQMFGDTIGTIYDLFVNSLQQILNYFDGLFTSAKGILDGFIEFIKGVFSGNWEQAWNGISQMFSSWFSGIVNTAKSFLNIIKNIVVSVAVTVGSTIADIFKSIVNGVLNAIESVLNTPIKTVNKLIGVINKVPGINLGTLPTFKLPRMAKGGIVNNPGKGVNMGSYIAGERGAEAIVPLENSDFINSFASKVASQMGSDVNTQLLVDLNKNILELANRPNIFNVNGQELARATYQDFQNEDNRQQKSMTVVRS